MASKKRKMKRGLRGTPSEHERGFAEHVRIAQRPSTHGCQTAIESLGAAKVHYSYMLTPTNADAARRERLGLKTPAAQLRAAREAIGAKCSCKKG